jgi:hypothetical protein
LGYQPKNGVIVGLLAQKRGHSWVIGPKTGSELGYRPKNVYFYFYVVAKWYICQMVHLPNGTFAKWYICQMAHSPNGTFAKWYIRQMAHSPNGTHPTLTGAQETFGHKGAFEIKETQQNSIILMGSLRAQE